MADDIVLPIPNLKLPQSLFVLSTPSLTRLHQNARVELLQGIEADQMAPYYRTVTSTSSASVPLDSDLLAKLEKANSDELQKLDDRLAEAEKQEGESEISDALRARANYLTRIGDKDRATAAQKLALEKTPGLGTRIDIVLTLIRIGFFFGDHDLITENLTKAEALVEEGGDWDRRNRLKVYNGLHLLSIRQFKRGGELLLDALSTFTAVELLSYNDFVALAVISGSLTLSRVDLKKKIMSAPEVNQVLPEVPILGDLVKNLYDCHYDKFFVALGKIYLPLAQKPVSCGFIQQLLNKTTSFHPVSSPHTLAITLTLDSLAAAFGVSIDFVDSELSRFIASGRLHCTIDKVHGIVETTRPALKTAQYETLIRQGDGLLTVAFVNIGSP
ncbi:hypothetical protein ONZ45_g10317 [Pleurotus djamor]|nr:hypothetical protein ONZ45_g10317 [Pleurotus djamor]